MYAGILPLMLALIALGSIRKKHVGFFVLLTVLALLTATGTPINRLFYFGMPGVQLAWRAESDSAAVSVWDRGAGGVWGGLARPSARGLTEAAVIRWILWVALRARRDASMRSMS